MEKRTLFILFFVFTGFLFSQPTKLYIARMNSSSPYIYSSDMDGSNQTYFRLSGKTPRSIAIDWNSVPTKIYVGVNEGGDYKIIRCNTDGTDIEDVKTDLSNVPNDIEIDVYNNVIYWDESLYDSCRIFEGPLGNNVKHKLYSINRTNRTIEGLALNVGDNSLWFTVKGSNSSKSFVLKMRANDGGELDTVLNPVNIPRDIEYYDNRYFLTTNDGLAKIYAPTESYSVIVSSETLGYGVAIDHTTNKIYFITEGYKVNRCNFDGDNLEVIEYTGSSIYRLETDYNIVGTPVELVSFNATVVNNSVRLNWQTATEVNNYGFEIQRSVSGERSEFETLGFVEGAGNSNSPKEYSFSDENPPVGKIQYRLKQIDIDGQFEYSEIVEVEIAAPTKFELLQNYPNPFNPTTTIFYVIASPDLSGRGNLSNGQQQIASSQAPRNDRSVQVSLKIYDALGCEVATLVNAKQTVGKYSIQFDGLNLPSGVYFYTLRAGNFVQTRKMVLMK